MATGLERRRFRRAGLAVPVGLRWTDKTSTLQQATGEIKDLSLAGVYCYLTADACTLKSGDSVICSVTVPPEQMRAFPFSRVSGQGIVVRVEPDAARVGLAVAFAPGITALGSIEY